MGSRPRPFDGGNLKAFCDVTIANKLLIHGVRIVQQDGKQPWVAMPSRKDGERWHPIVEIPDRGLRQQVSDAVLAAWRGWA